MERLARRERSFKRLILLATSLVLADMLWTSPWSRSGAATAASEARQVVRQVLSLPRPRAEVDAACKRYRELGIEIYRRALDRVYAEEDPAMQRLMRYAGLDPGHGMLRWGHYNLTLLLPSKVFEPDDEGRSYRLRPSNRSIWLWNLTIPNGALMFSRRRSGFYPGKIANILDDSGLMFLNPTDSFINAHLERLVAAEQDGDRPRGCTLFNEAIGDGHFSADGSDVWAQSVGGRLILLMKRDRVLTQPAARLHHEKALDPANPRTTSRPTQPAHAGLRREDAAP
jgi:hypothetical protein